VTGAAGGDPAAGESRDPTGDDARIAATRARFFALHALDPRPAPDEGREVSFETAYHARLERWLARRAPDASPALRLAAMAQHVGRHALPRADFPDGPAGYKRWRAAAALRHATIAEATLRDAGWDDATVVRVRALLLKKGLGADAAARDPEAQILEDAVCLAFLDGELPAFAAKHPEDKVVDVLRKTWAKMSPAGRAAARALVAVAPAGLRALVDRALGG
jgi:hypothetical protein